MCRLLDEHTICNAHGNQDSFISPLSLIQEMVQCKAHRRGQGEGIVTYVEPHSRSNAAMCRLLNEHTICNTHGNQDSFISPLSLVQEMVQCKAHRSRPPECVVTYGEGVGEEQRSNVPFIE